MEISNARYHRNFMGEATNYGCIEATIDGQTWFIPISEKNSHYQEIMRQVDAGTLTIADAD
jgi:hypothetical protein